MLCLRLLVDKLKITMQLKRHHLCCYVFVQQQFWLNNGTLAFSNSYHHKIQFLSICLAPTTSICNTPSQNGHSIKNAKSHAKLTFFASVLKGWDLREYKELKSKHLSGGIFCFVSDPNWTWFDQCAVAGWSVQKGWTVQIDNNNSWVSKDTVAVVYYVRKNVTSGLPSKINVLIFSHNTFNRRQEHK